MPADTASLCWHQSEPSDQGVFRCTKRKGHDGPHQSAQAHWWSDPPSHERTAACAHEWDDSDAQIEWCRKCGSGRLGRAYREAARLLSLGVTHLGR